MNKIKSLYLLKDEILLYVPLKRVLQIFKSSKRYLKLLKLYPSIYELYHNIQNDFEPYNEHIENEMLSYIIHFSRLQRHLSDNLLLEYYFRFLLTQKKIIVEYDNINFVHLLNYFNSKKYSGTLIIKLGEPKLDLSIRPNIEVKGDNFFLEINFNMKWIDREKKDNIDYIKSFLSEKIIGEETKKHVKKIEFGEHINLNEEKYEDFFFEQLSMFPNALFNIQSNYFEDNVYWSELDRFFKLKFIIADIIEEKEKENKEENNNNIINTNINNNITNNIINNTKTNEINDKINNEIDSNTNNNENNIINSSSKNNDNNQNEINIINEEKLIPSINEEYIKKINNLNKTILSIKELNNFILDFRKNKIGIVNQFFDIYKEEIKNIKNKIPSKLTLINFIYEKNKEYFGELNNHINKLAVVQRIYRNTPYPFFISPNLTSLIVLKLERINILEDNLVSIVNSNPLLEIFEIHKNYTGYVFGFNLALALSSLQNLKALVTEFFWYKDYVPNFKTNNLVNKQENEFFKFLTSKSIHYLSFANETNINIKTINQNLPNLVSLSMESSNFINENNNNEESNINTDSNNNLNLNNKISGEIKRNRFSLRDKYKKKMSAPLIQTNYLKEFNYSEKDRLFHKLRDLTIVRIKNCDDFFKNMAFFNKIENLYLESFEAEFLNTFVKFGYYLNNLDALYVSPDLSDRIKPAQSEKMVKIIHYFKKLTIFEIGFYCINENLVNLLYDELTKLPLLQQLKIIVDISSEENKAILQNKINQLKDNKYNSKYLTITYNFLDKKFKR